MSTLRWRNEWKYWISWEQYHVLRTRLRPLARRDAHTGSGGEYRVRSLYFDTADEQHAFEKLSGTSRRGKYRIRIYDCDDDWGRLEIKHRDGLRVAKESVKLTRDEVEKLIAREDMGDQARAPALAKLQMGLRRSGARPKCIVEYIREPFIYGPGNVRITFDKHLRAGPWCHRLYDPDVPMITVPGEGAMILEVKYDGFLPLVLKHLFPPSIQGPVAISKYMLCRPTLCNWDNGS
jgi:hypothetical protein